jgi:hypothetical protein
MGTYRRAMMPGNGKTDDKRKAKKKTPWKKEILF